MARVYEIVSPFTVGVVEANPDIDWKAASEKHIRSVIFNIGSSVLLLNWFAEGLLEGVHSALEFPSQR